MANRAKNPRPKQEYSTEGPVCPFCQVVFTPDENYFYNESGFVMDCDCGGHFHVRPECSWSWDTRARTFEEG